MEISHIRSLAEMEMEDPSFIHQWPMNSMDELSPMSMEAALGKNILNQSYGHQMFDFKDSIKMSHTGVDQPQKQLKSNSWTSCISDHMSIQHAASSSKSLHFSNTNYTNQLGFIKAEEETVSSKNGITPLSNVLASQGSFGNPNYVFKDYQGAKTTSSRFSHTQDHIIAERKRREKLSQRFIALSALVPGLKKMDKSSVLGDAVKYLKQLQERVKTLEELSRKKSIESVVFVKKHELYSNGDNSLDENFSGGPVDEPLPEIEARFSDNEVLIRIHCEKRKGVLDKTVVEIEKLHLSVINTSVMAFGTYALEITIIAQKDVEFSITIKDLVKNLHSALKLFM